jgi:hypothetical protein
LDSRFTASWRVHSIVDTNFQGFPVLVNFD